MFPTSSVPRRLIRAIAAPAALVILLGCAQQRQPGYYEAPRESTQSDAISRAKGDSNNRTPTQLQLGFGDQAQTPAPDSPAAPVKPAIPPPLAETHTFLGTVPCLDQNACPATRVTLTLAPDGQWRARSVALNAAQTTIAQMGCWVLTSQDPLRIALRIDNAQTKALLEFVNGNTLLVRSFDGRQTRLDYRLTRQPDTDPIKELAKQPAQDCTAPGT
ncbi:MAG: copper resistance protein NlpE [Alcaligenaceae bacterium]|nr:copper resistance protein NlpE [Alcaligenaceae bacterium]